MVETLHDLQADVARLDTGVARLEASVQQLELQESSVRALIASKRLSENETVSCGASARRCVR